MTVKDFWPGQTDSLRFVELVDKQADVVRIAGGLVMKFRALHRKAPKRENGNMLMKLKKNEHEHGTSVL